MLTLLTVLYIIAGILLIILVLLQSNRSSGMGILGGSSDSLLGASSGDFFTKVTSILAVIFIVGAVALSIMSAGKPTSFDKPVAAPQPSEVQQATAPALTNLLPKIGVSNTQPE